MTTSASPEYRQNPAPRQAYRLTMRIDDAPGPFGSIVALAQFDVQNRECLPPPDSNPGGRQSPVPTMDLEIPLARDADGAWVGIFHTDAMLDEDYHGRGTCVWQWMGTRVHLRATGADGETIFLPSLSAHEASPEQTVDFYFLKEGYPQTSPANYSDLGIAGRERVPADLADEALFSIQLRSEAVRP